MPRPSLSPIVLYVAFDNKTGRILHTHSEVSAESGRHLECDTAGLRVMLLRDSSLVKRLTDENVKHLKILKIISNTNPFMRSRSGLLVDVKKKKLVERPRLMLTTSKRELAGDGMDKAIITLRAITSKGKPIRKIRGKVKVTTTRGKLSARGGVVDLVNGKAMIKLTTVNETVSQVKVAAESLDGTLSRGTLDLEFV